MYCTRWVLPLLLLPFPTASPYFLIIFLFSLALHSRPCIYCIVLLSILFVSSCYWSPIPTSSPLTTPWADNISTFHEALVATMNASSSVQELTIPKYIRPLDRCWCDLTSGSLFEPFNTTRWERASILRAKHELEQENEPLPSSVDMDQGADILLLSDNATTSHESTSSSAATSPSASPTPHPTPLYRSVIKGARILYRHLRIMYEDHQNPKPPAPVPSTTPKVTRERPVEQGLEPLRSVYDLQSHGFDIIIDFRWTRGQ